MARVSASAELRLESLLERLLNWAEVSLRAGDLDQAAATAEEVRAVDPDNERAASVLQRVAARRDTQPWGERALMTLLFSDVVGSTQLSERVEPEQLRDLYAFYRRAVDEAVRRYGGSLVEFYGDGVLAGFGYPAAHEDDARRAVLAGLDMLLAMSEGRQDLQRRIGVSAELRVGIHTGVVVISGMRGDSALLSRDSILGVTPNLAARVQGAGDPGTVVVSDVTRQLVDADFFLRSLGERRLRGITRPVELFAVDRPRYAAARFTAERYRQAGLVGREEPIARLRAAWDEVVAHPGEPGTLLVLTGEAGIGKSRLVVELLDRVQASGGDVLGSGCLPYYVNVPLWPVARMFERAADLADRWRNEESLGPLQRHLTNLGLEPTDFVPVLGPLVGLSSASFPAPELEPSALLEVTMSRLVEWLSALSNRTPYLLVIEDLHWADPTTIELLRRVCEQRPPSVLTVATTRDPGSVPWIRQAKVLQLPRLDSAAARQLVANLSTGRQLSEDELATIVEQAEGNPLFVEELARSCLAKDRTDPMPLRLQELFTWRLKSPSVDLRVVQVAATLGPVFRGSVLAAVVGDESRVEKQVRALLEGGIIEPTASADTYRFRHALMRDAAYETQVLDVRAEVHAEVAEVLAKVGTEPALVATHLDLAGLDVRAAALYVVGAQTAQARGAHQEATRLLSRALELYQAMPASEDRDLGELGALMLRVFSVTAMRGYGLPEVEADQARAETLARGLGDRPEVLVAVVVGFAYRLNSGDIRAALALTQQLQRMTRDPAFASFQAEVDGCAGFAHFYLGNLSQAQSFFERSIDGFHARPLGNDVVSPYWPVPNDPLASSEIGLACVATLRGEPDEASRHEDEAVRRAEALGFPRGPFTVGLIKTYAAWRRQFLGDEDGVRNLAAEVVAVGSRYGYAYWVAMGAVFLGGPPGRKPSTEFMEATVADLKSMGYEAHRAWVLSLLARVQARAGNHERARQFLGEALEAAESTGEMMEVPEILRRRAMLSLEHRGDARSAADDLLVALATAARQGAVVSRLRAAVAIAELPPEYRPAGWLDALREARAAVSPSAVTPETAAADQLLRA